MSDPFHAFVDRDPDAAFGDGPLAGVRAGIKANIAVKGLPWTAGMGLRRAIVAERDAEVVARLRGAGAAILGTLNMHEAALGSTTDNPFYGRTTNPHCEGFTPGGSSGGSGAAVAAGFCDLALGTDTLGSVRIPAAYCGVYGLKPTADAVPQDGLVVLDARLDAIGPLARDLDMLEAGWRTVADRPGEAVQFQRAFTLADLGGVELEPPVRDAWRKALAAIDLPRGQIELAASLDSIRVAAFAGIGRAIAEDLGPDIDGDGISKELRFVINAALGLAFDEALLASAKSALIEALGEDSVLVLPTAPQVAFAHTPRPPASQPLFTGLANVAGLPALACPAGRDDRGLPLSIQLVGPPGSEPGLIDLARRIEPALGGFVAPPAFQGEPQCA
ncbi:MAG: amidase [Tsuneonella sp.]